MVLLRRGRMSVLHLSAFTLLASLLLHTACATIDQGTMQAIPITSDPPRAKVFVDGKLVSETPTVIKARRKTQCLIRIEKEGYRPYEIGLKRRLSGYIFAEAIAGSLLGWSNYRLQGSSAGLAGAFYGVLPMAVDLFSGAAFKHVPTRIEVELFELAGREVSRETRSAPE